MASTKDLLKCYGNRIDRMKNKESQLWERGLYFMLKDYETELPKLDEKFRMSFKKASVTSSPAADTAIFNMLSASTVFSEAFTVVTKKVLK